MRVCLAVRGEGPNDYGIWDRFRGRLVQEGCYLAFVRKAALQNVSRAEIHWDCVQADRYAKKLPGGKSRKQRMPKLRGFEPHTFYSTLEALHAKADWLVIGTDTDRGLERGKGRLQKACYGRYEQLRSGYEKAKEFEPEAGRVGLVILVPLVKLESWLLADERGFRSATGFARGPLPEKPEELYGQTDAKAYLDKLFQNHRQCTPDTADKAHIAAMAQPSVLAKECPVSYFPFLDHLRMLLPTRPNAAKFANTI